MICSDFHASYVFTFVGVPVVILALVLFQNMSSMAATNSSLMSEIADITECSICTGVFQEPRCLPCAHTFCLGCLEVYGRGAKPSKKALCPICRKQFTVPSGGWKDLPRNYIVDKLLSTNPVRAAVKNSSREGTSLTADYLCKSVTLQIGNCHQLADRLKERVGYLSQKSQEVKQDILRHRDELKSLVDSNTEELLGKVDHICESTVQKLTADQRAIEARCSELKVLQIKLTETANANDPKEHLEAIALKMKPLMSEVECDILDSDISFTEAELSLSDGNVVGSVDICKNTHVMSKCYCLLFQQVDQHVLSIKPKFCSCKFVALSNVDILLAFSVNEMML